MTTVSAEKLIHVPPEQVYFYLTHASGLTQWLCDFATVAPRPGGRMYLWWHGDFYSAGEYLALEENKSVKFKWFARIDPAPSEVLVTLTPKDDGTLVRFEHTVPEGADWAKIAEGFRHEWESTLPYLAAVLETGLDKRVFDRPMLGIMISDFNAEIAKAAGIPVSQGIRLDSAREGMGAYAAGLRRDDVLVEMDGHALTNDFGSLQAALVGKKGGDKVPVTFYRGAEKMTTVMELSKRPIPDIPWEPAELARRMQAKYDESLAALEACFQGVSEAQADFEPAPGEWSAKETLAHLVQNDRNQLSNLEDAIGGFPRVSDDWAGNSSVHIKATVKAYGTARGLLDEMKRLSVEAVAMLADLPKDFVGRKGDYFVNAAQLLEMESHTLSHVEQIKAAIAAAPKS